VTVTLGLHLMFPFTLAYSYYYSFKDAFYLRIQILSFSKCTSNTKSCMMV